MCSHCLKIGHNVDSCRLLTKENTVPIVKNKTQEVQKVFNIINDGRQKQGTLLNDPIVVEEEVIMGLDKNVNASGPSKQIEKKKNTAHVTVEVESSNKFQALVQKSLVDDLQKDAELEAEVNEALANQDDHIAVEDDESDRSSSEFVENTQAQSSQGPVIVPIDNALPSSSTETDRFLEIERNNKEFLENSWANIAFDKEEDQRLLKQLENDPHEGFQEVRRSKGKVIKKQSLVKSNYITRNKSGNPKPFR